jgi:hypothetical protein
MCVLCPTAAFTRSGISISVGGLFILVSREVSVRATPSATLIALPSPR